VSGGTRFQASPPGRGACFARYPALKCRATINRPAGTREAGGGAKHSFAGIKGRSQVQLGNEERRRGNGSWEDGVFLNDVWERRRAYAAALGPGRECCRDGRGRFRAAGRELLRKSDVGCGLAVLRHGEKGLSAGFLKILLHDLGAFDFRNGKFFELGAVGGDPSGAAFDALRGDLEIGQKEGEALEGAEGSDEGCEEFDRHIVLLSLWCD
jgi:hypothetical protein